MTTPRVFLIRHGETEWSLSGRHTGVSDIPLTSNGEKRILATGRALVGPDRLIVPERLVGVFVSPRRRARRTLELLGGCGIGGAVDPGDGDGGGGGGGGGGGRKGGGEEEEEEEGKRRIERWIGTGKVEVRDDVREWDYGEYEGVKTSEIQTQRREKGVEGKWDIWRDGCPGGESPAQITTRLDALISEIRQRFHHPVMSKHNYPDPNSASSSSSPPPSDLLIVAHGHILRAFAARWVGVDIALNPSLILEAGGVGTLSYEHNSIHEPAILLGGAFAVSVD